MSKVRVECDDCQKRSPVMVILKNDLWTKISPNKSLREFLCLTCMEKRLGREISLEDLEPGPVRDDLFMGAILAAQTHPTVLAKYEILSDLKPYL